MLKDIKVDRFIDDFTRQWLQRDKVDDFGPDVRVYKNVRRMTVDSMGREGRELFRHLLRRTSAWNILSTRITSWPMTASRASMAFPP